MSNKVYCMYCGTDRYGIAQLTSESCSNNPESQYHVPYEGSIEKDKYTCKYCGADRYSLSQLTSESCNKSPSKRHIPSIH